MNARITASLILLMANIVCAAQEGIFVDTILKCLIEEAMENNSELQIAELNVKQAEIMLSSARLTYLPSFVFAPSASMANPLGGEKTRIYALPVTMSWELSLGGREKGEKRVAKAHLQYLQEEYRYAKVLVASSVANAYYTLVMLDWQKSITRESIINQEATLSVEWTKLRLIRQKAAFMQFVSALVRLSCKYPKLKRLFLCFSAGRRERLSGIVLTMCCRLPSTLQSR